MNDNLIQPSLVHGLTLFQNLPDVEIEKLCKGSTFVQAKSRRALFYEGEPADFFAIIISGYFKLIKKGADQKTALISILSKDEVLGVLMMAQPSMYPVTAISVGAGSVLKIPRSTYMDHWLGHSEIMRRIHLVVQKRLCNVHEIKSMQRMPLESKIAGYILGVLERFCEPDSTCLAFALPRKDIADALGASVESVVRVMSIWEQNSIISTQSQKIEVLDEAALAQLYNNS